MSLNNFTPSYNRKHLFEDLYCKRCGLINSKNILGDNCCATDFFHVGKILNIKEIEVVDFVTLRGKYILKNVIYEICSLNTDGMFIVPTLNDNMDAYFVYRYGSHLELDF
jgi:hypothetical protein